MIDILNEPIKAIRLSLQLIVKKIKEMINKVKEMLSAIKRTILSICKFREELYKTELGINL